MAVPPSKVATPDRATIADVDPISRHATHPRRLDFVTGLLIALFLVGLVGWRQAARPPAQVLSVAQAEVWLSSNLAPGSRLITDPQVRTDLLAARWPTADLAGPHPAPGAWRSYDFMVSTPRLRAVPSPLTRVTSPNTTLLASFGQGALRTDIFRLDPTGLKAAQADDASLVRLSAQAGRQLASNTQVSLEAQAGIQATDGDVDPRLIALLVALGAQHRITVLRFTTAPTDGTIRGQLHGCTLSTIDDLPVTESGTQTQDVATWLAAQHPPYRITTLGVDDQGNLLIVLPYAGAHMGASSDDPLARSTS